MKRIFFILSLIFCLNIVNNAKTFKGYFTDMQHEIDLDIHKSNIIGYSYQGDTLLVRSKHPIFDFGEDYDDKFYWYDLIIDEEAVNLTKQSYEKILSGNNILPAEFKEEFPEMESIIDLWVMLAYESIPYDQPICDPIFEIWLKKKCPHGFVNDWDWKTDIIDCLDSFKLEFFNSSNKTIKTLKVYINFKDENGFYIKPIRNKTYDIELIYNNKIHSMETRYIQWDLSNTFILDAKYCNINKIVIHYTDGTKYTLIKELKFNSGTF